MARMKAAGAHHARQDQHADVRLDRRDPQPALRRSRAIPWNLDRTPGGSSGGASAAVAAGLGPLPSAPTAAARSASPRRCTGIVGFKPSFGRVPIYPASGAWSLSHVGPDDAHGGRRRADAAGVRGARRARSSTRCRPTAWTTRARSPGRVKGCAGGVDGRPRVRRLRRSRGGGLCARAARAFRELGCRVEEVKPRVAVAARSAWYELFCGGIAARLAPYLDRRDEIDPGLLRIIETELRNPPTKYVQAWFDRLAWWQHPRAFFEKYDLLLTPTLACPPFKVGLDNPTEIAGRPAVPYAWIPVHVPVQSHRPAGGLGARAGSPRTGCRSACRSSAAASPTPPSARGGRVRAAAALGAAPPPDRLSSRSISAFAAIAEFLGLRM